jgi:hypothetical protein
MLATLAGAYQLALRGPASARLRPASPPDLVVQRATEPVAASAPAGSSTPADTVAGCRAGPVQFVRGSPASRRPVGLHRYVGTVGGEPATALLSWQNPDSVAGSFYLHRRGPAYSLQLARRHQGQAVLTLDDDRNANQPGEWYLRGRPGAVLRGTWHSPTGNQPFYLRESYAGAVQLEVRTLRLHGGRPAPSFSPCGVPSSCYDYLRFLAPQALAPALRRALSLPLATHRRRLWVGYNQSSVATSELSDFLLNDFHLLSYRVWHTHAYLGEGADTWTESYLFDLVSGRRLSLASQLRPGYELPLRRLVQRHLRELQLPPTPESQQYAREINGAQGGQENARVPNDSALVELPVRAQYYNTAGYNTAGMALAGAGLEVTYRASDLHEDGADIGETLLISYRELRPLVRPGTPLARMLQARGLW